MTTGMDTDVSIWLVSPAKTVRKGSGEVCAGGTIPTGGGDHDDGDRPTGPQPVAVKDRSLSAVTWCVSTKMRGFPLSHHTAFFSGNYEEEFRQVFGRRSSCEEPTVYVCAQDRYGDRVPPGETERLLLLVNAPATGDQASFGPALVDDVSRRAWSVRECCGRWRSPRARYSMATLSGRLAAMRLLGKARGTRTGWCLPQTAAPASRSGPAGRTH